MDEKYKKSYPTNMDGQVRHQFFISEPGVYSRVFASKLEAAKKFQDWVFAQVLPSIRKYGQYKLFDNPNNLIFKGNLHFNKKITLNHRK